MLVTCAVQFCKENFNGDYKATGKKQYFYNFPNEFAVLGNVYDIETNIGYSNPVMIVSVLNMKYTTTDDFGRPGFTGRTMIKEVKRIKKILCGHVNYEAVAEAMSEKATTAAMTENKNVVKKENTNMKNMFGMNFEFGKVPAGKFKMSFMGLAFATGNGRYAVYNIGDNEFTDVTEMTMDVDGMIMQMPVAAKDVAVGDIIKHKDAYVIVKGGTENGCITAVDPFKSEEINIIPTKSMFGFNFVTKVINVFGNMFGENTVTPSEDNPFGNIAPFIMMSAMSDGNNDNDGMMKMLLMSQMMNGQSGMDFSKNPMLMFMLAKNM